MSGSYLARHEASRKRPTYRKAQARRARDAEIAPYLEGAVWNGKPYGELTRQQRLQARSRGFATGPNLTTATGLGVSLYGAELAATGRPWLGALVFFGGSLLDLVDGPWSRRFGVTSRLGAGADAGADKARLGAGAGAVIVAHLMPLAESLPLAGVQLTILGISVAGLLRHQEMRAEKTGKWTAALTTASIAANMAAAKAAESGWNPAVTAVLQAVGAVATAGALAAGLLTIISYQERAFAPDPGDDVPGASPELAGLLASDAADGRIAFAVQQAR